MGDISDSPFLMEIVNPWYRSLEDPRASQEGVLRSLLEGYAKTEYGVRFGANEALTMGAFQERFPVTDYARLQPYLDRVMKGEYSALLPEPVERWVMTRGTTGAPKVIPTTATHLSQIMAIGARAIVNFAMKRDPDILGRNVLNLNFPSEVGRLAPGAAAREQAYGYSSGSYAKLNPSLGPTALVPKQEEIDALGSGIGREDWERRFELVYQRAKDAPVGSIMGVTPVLTAFARFLTREHDLLPRQLWEMRGLFCTSVAKIQTKYAPTLRHCYGAVPLIEMYTATEGVFAQQIDERPYVSPNYDVYLLEVRTPGGAVKLLHDLRPNEWGRLIISGPLFPRYDIGDMVESVGKNCFRVFGRAGWSTTLEHTLFGLLTGTLRF